MTLPEITNWDLTKNGLHQAARALGVIRTPLVEPDPNWLHVALRKHSQGLTTLPLAGIGELILSFDTAEVIYKPEAGDEVRINTNEYTQQSLADQVLTVLADHGHTEIEIDREKLPHDTRIDIDTRTAAAYRRVMHIMIDALESFRSSLPADEVVDEVVVWGHGFDAAFLWFAGDEKTEEGPHMGFGFSPGSEGHDYLYLYTYPWPAPENLTEFSTPDLTEWTTEAYTGTLTLYNDLRTLNNPQSKVVEILKGVFNTVAPALRE